MNFKGFIFDMDGTLLDTIPICYIGFRSALLKFLGREYSDQEIAALFGPTEEGIFKKILPDSWQDGLSCYLAEYERWHHQATPFPGILTVLESLKEQKTKLAIVSGKGPGSMEISLRHSGLGKFFEPVITGSEHAANKIADIYHVLQLWRLGPEEVAYIGDTAYDIKAAKEAGVFPIAALWAESANVQRVKDANPGISFENVQMFIQWINDIQK